jgi:polyisoprenoid-binding protein YceI
VALALGLAGALTAAGWAPAITGAIKPGTIKLVVAPTGNEARYRVQEQLVHVDLPNDAIGRTTAVTGGIAFDSTGQIIPESSQFVIQAATLATDRDRRDGYVRRRILETDQYPTIVLNPTAVRGLTWPLPAQGTDSFQLIGNLTIKGVSHPTTWNAVASFNHDTVTGTAATDFTFDDMQLQQPRVPIVLSVADTIHLEYDFRLAPGGAAGN